MKYIFILLVFILGIAVGRWTAPSSDKNSAGSDVVATLEKSNTAPEKKPTTASINAPTQNPKSATDLGNFERSENSARDKKMMSLYYQLVDAGKKGDFKEQNSILDRKSTRLNSSHTDISRMPSSA